MNPYFIATIGVVISIGLALVFGTDPSVVAP